MRFLRTTHRLSFGRVLTRYQIPPRDHPVAGVVGIFAAFLLFLSPPLSTPNLNKVLQISGDASVAHIGSGRHGTDSKSPAFYNGAVV